MNILMGFNSAYIEHAKVTIYSLALNCKEHIYLYLLYSNIKNKELRELKTFVKKKCHGELYPFLIDEKMFEIFSVKDHFSKETYYRIYAQYLLPEEVTRILWLDADIVIKDTISELYEKEFEGNCLIACENLGDNTEHINRLNLEGKYFNAGVLLMNLPAMREKMGVVEFGRKVVDNLSLFLWQDQDILNFIYKESVIFVDYKKYNFQVIPDFEIQEKELDNAKIVHYIGSQKPWQYFYLDTSQKYYHEYLKKIDKLQYLYLRTMKAGYGFLKRKRIKKNVKAN